MNPNCISLIQIAFKSGNVSMGDRLISSIQTKKAHLVIANQLCGNNRKKKLKDKCSYYEVPYIELGASDFDKITKRNIQSFSITNKELANKISEQMKG